MCLYFLRLVHITVSNFYTRGIRQNCAGEHTKAFKEKGINGNCNCYRVLDGLSLRKFFFVTVLSYQYSPAGRLFLSINHICAMNIGSFENKVKINEDEVRDSLVSIRVSA